jgi:hypothetical protein
MDIIPIQASSVPCERVFSSGKETMAPRRRRIVPQLMEMLQLLKFSYHKVQPLNFTEGMRWDEELKELELSARTTPPEDPEAYSHDLKVPEKDEKDLMDEVEKMLEESPSGDEVSDIEELYVSESED